jgi:hypothetical protein
VVGKHTDCVDLDLVAGRGDGDAVRKNPIGQRRGLEPKLPLGAASSE